MNGIIVFFNSRCFITYWYLSLEKRK